MTQLDAHPLDNPIWSSLAMRHSHFRLGGARACRYRADIAPFAAIADEAPVTWQALHGLLGRDEQLSLFERKPIDVPPVFEVERPGVLQQMVLVRISGESADTTGITRLSNADAAEMRELALRTKPGPFLARAHETGHYIGVRDGDPGGRLIAMAGERMCLDNHVEISAVCVDDAHRGKGLANQLVRALLAEIAQRGQTPFLHVFDHNHVAIALYERLGFVARQSFHLTQVRRREA